MAFQGWQSREENSVGSEYLQWLDFPNWITVRVETIEQAKWMAFPQISHGCFTSLGGKGKFAIFIVIECLPLTMFIDITENHCSVSLRFILILNNYWGRFSFKLLLYKMLVN